MPDRKSLSLDQYSMKLANEIPEFGSAYRAEQANLAFCAKTREDLRQMREQMGVTQKDLADRLEISQSAVSKIEGGDGDIGLLTLCRYAGALGMQPTLTFSPAASTYLRQDDIRNAVSAMVRLTERRNDEVDRQMHQQIRHAVSQLKTMDLASNALPSLLVSLVVSQMTETVVQSVSTRIASLMSAASDTDVDTRFSALLAAIEAPDSLSEPEVGRAVAD